MARTFNGTTDFLSGTPGALVGMDAGPITIAAIIRLDANTPGSSIIYAGAGDVTGVDLGIYDGLFYLGSQEPSLATASTADGWHLVAANKAAGTTTPRWHKYVIASDTWTHANAGGTMGDGVAVGGGDTLQIGRWGTASTRFVGSIAIVGVWDRVLSDAEIEQLPFSLQAWYTSGPKACLLLDQASATTSIADITGGGANITGGTGTTVASSSLPIFSYGLPVLINSPAPAAGENATVEPSVVACTASVPSAAVSTGSTIAPATVTAVAAMGAAAVSTGSTVLPAVTTGAANIGAPAVATGSTVAPGVIALTADIPAAGVGAGSTVTPELVAAIAAIGSPSLSTGMTVAPTVITAAVTIPAPTVDISGTDIATTYTVGRPYTRWHTGRPRTRWHVGRPREG